MSPAVGQIVNFLGTLQNEGLARRRFRPSTPIWHNDRTALPLAEDKAVAGIVQAGTPAQPYYTNSSQLPVGFTDDPFEALERQEALQAKYTGGTVPHPTWRAHQQRRGLPRTGQTRALQLPLPHHRHADCFSIRPTHGYLAGEHRFCPDLRRRAPGREGAGSRKRRKRRFFLSLEGEGGRVR